MQARASFRGAQVSTAVVRLFMVALLSAFLLGGAGGYLVRGLSSPPSTTTTNVPYAHPFVVEPAPYSGPASSPAPDATSDPSGHLVPI